MGRRRDPVTTATDIRVARGEVVANKVAEVNEKGAVTGYTYGSRVCSRLERMKNRREITPLQAKAGERFALDFEQSEPSVKSCLAADAKGGDLELVVLTMGESAAIASRRIGRACRALGIRLSAVLVWVAVEGRSAKEWAERMGMPRSKEAGTTALRLALETLVSHYGLDTESDSGVSNQLGG